jgi:hypothetical protein
MKPETSLDREIEAMLAVEPSPDFVSRVRTRIAEAPAPGWITGLNMGWTSLAAGSVVVAVFVAVVISKPHETVQPEAMLPVARTSVQTESPSDDLPIPSRVNPAKSPEPQLLINPKEAAAIRRFLASPQPERVELSVMKIEPQPLPEFTFIPVPTFDPTSVLQGDYK